MTNFGVKVGATAGTAGNDAGCDVADLPSMAELGAAGGLSTSGPRHDMSANAATTMAGAHRSELLMGRSAPLLAFPGSTQNIAQAATMHAEARSQDRRGLRPFKSGAIIAIIAGAAVWYVVWLGFDPSQKR